MDLNNYYERHLYRPRKFIFSPISRRILDFFLTHAETYPRSVDGRVIPPGRVDTTHARICADLGISEREFLGSINELLLKEFVRLVSYSETTISVTILLDPDEITTPPESNEVGPRNDAPARPKHSETVNCARPKHPEKAPSKILPQPAHPKWSVALDRPHPTSKPLHYAQQSCNIYNSHRLPSIIPPLPENEIQKPHSHNPKHLKTGIYPTN